MVGDADDSYALCFALVLEGFNDGTSTLTQSLDELLMDRCSRAVTAVSPETLWCTSFPYLVFFWILKLINRLVS